jgi:hypothetical protein
MSPPNACGDAGMTAGRELLEMRLFFVPGERFGWGFATEMVQSHVFLCT